MKHAFAGTSQTKAGQDYVSLLWPSWFSTYIAQCE